MTSECSSVLPETNDDENGDDQTRDDADNGHEKQKEIEPGNRPIVQRRNRRSEKSERRTNTATIENFHGTKLIEDRTRGTRRRTKDEQRRRWKITTTTRKKKQSTLLVHLEGNNDARALLLLLLINWPLLSKCSDENCFSTHLRDDAKKELLVTLNSDVQGRHIRSLF